MTLQSNSDARQIDLILWGLGLIKFQHQWGYGFKTTTTASLKTDKTNQLHSELLQRQGSDFSVNSCVFVSGAALELPNELLTLWLTHNDEEQPPGPVHSSSICEIEPLSAG